MYKSIRCLLLIATLVPTMVLAQQKTETEPTTSITIDLSGLADGLSELAALSELSVLSDLSSVVDVQELAKLEVKVEPLLRIENQASTFNSEKRKSFDKTYKVSNSELLNIENKFGKIHVNTWNRKEVQVRIDIVARASSEQNAQKILDGITISESRDSKMISLRTEMESIRTSGNSNRSFEINYTVFMPEENPVALKNSFGEVYLADLKGKADITVKYGSLKTNNLSNSSNNIRVAFGSGSCGFINHGNIDVAYSDFSVDGTNGLQGSSKFSDLIIGSLGEVLTMDVKYGSFKVDNISRNVRSINVASGFSPVSLGFADNSAFDFDVNVQFADFKYDKSSVNITSLEKGHTSAEYKGRYGGSTAKGSVNVVSKYGDVKFIR
ncbi:hypothetical protein ACFSKU_04310 [Pontibacter silvestris]|uniref:Adhesin domain-containing protein n=1 Tax=Pontibacter silvestris TaxID=2305183 RepID=A0ABW4WTM0_9BACT|nr:hypothetical protein [Pontibacter silvestris]MCC9137199.1 hypothetical protein [Pontibacter silvestris]